MRNFFKIKSYLNSSRYFGILLFSVLVTGFSVNSQTSDASSSWGNVYVQEGASISVFGSHSFYQGTGVSLDGKIGAQRKVTNAPFITFYGDMNKVESQGYVDGLVKYSGVDNANLIFPVGSRDSSGDWYPSPGISLSKPTGATVAYYRSDPAIAIVGAYQVLINTVSEQLPTGESYKGTNKDQQILSKSEYWSIDSSTPVKLKLNWNSNSNVQTILGGANADALSIAAYSKASNKWEYFSANVTPKNNGNLDLGGTIETKQEIIPDNYKIFTISRVPQDFVDLEINVSTQVVSASIGDILIFRTRVTNHGPNDITGVVLTETPVAGLTVMTTQSLTSAAVGTTNSGGVYNYSTGVWNIGTLKVGEEVYADVAYLVEASLGNKIAGKEVTKIEHNSTDLGKTPDVLKASVPVDDGIDLDIDINSRPDAVVGENELVTFDLSVFNKSRVQLDEAVLKLDINDTEFEFESLVLPTGITYDSKTKQFTIKNLPANTKVDFQYRAFVRKGTNGRVLTVLVSLDSSTIPDATTGDKLAEQVTVDNTLVPNSRVNLEINKTVDDNKPFFGGTVVYKITVKNWGPGTAKGLSLTDKLPDGVKYTSNTATSGDYDVTTGIWTIGELKNRAEETLKITVQANKIKKVVNRISYIKLSQDIVDTGSVDDDLVEEIDIIGVTICDDPNDPKCQPLPPCVDKTIDTDGDGIIDCEDADADGDGILSIYEGIDIKDYKNHRDSDGDGIPDYLDSDDDGDGILTKDEAPDLDKDKNPKDARDTDYDGVPDYLEPNYDEEVSSNKNDDLIIYNYITINGDNNNDALIISGIEKYPNNEVTVFNKWGAIVFKTTEYGTSTDKTFRGTITEENIIDGSNQQTAQTLTPGTYFYIIKYEKEDEGQKKISGYLYIEID